MTQLLLQLLLEALLQLLFLLLEALLVLDPPLLSPLQQKRYMYIRPTSGLCWTGTSTIF